MTPAVYIPEDYNEELARQLQEQRDLFVAFGNDLSRFLIAAYPHVGQGLCSNVAESLVAFITCGTDREIKSLTSPTRYGIATPDMLVHLTKERDELQEQLAQLEAAMESIPVEGMGGIFEASLGAPMRRRLADIEERMSHIQAELEKVPA